MGFKDTKVPGNKILSGDWNSLVGFTVATSSNAYGASSNYSIHKGDTTIHLTYINVTAPASGHALVWNGTNWVDRGVIVTI